MSSVDMNKMACSPHRMLHVYSLLLHQSICYYEPKKELLHELNPKLKLCSEQAIYLIVKESHFVLYRVILSNNLTVAEKHDQSCPDGTQLNKF